MSGAATYVIESRIRGLLFDLDDTLFDHTGSSAEAVWGWSQEWPGWSLDESETAALWHRVEDRHFGAYAAGEIAFLEHRRNRVRDFVAGAADEDDASLDALFAEYLRRYTAAWRPLPDTVGVVATALDRGYRVGVLTNGRTEQQRAKLDAIGLTDPRIVLLAVEAVPALKPAAEAYAVACAALGLPADRVLMVGDNWTADVDGALRAGLSALHVRRPGFEPTAEDDQVPWVSSVGRISFP